MGGGVGVGGSDSGVDVADGGSGATSGVPAASSSGKTSENHDGILDALPPA